MLKNKKMVIVAAGILTLAIGTGAIFATFFTGVRANDVTVGTANLDFCFNQQLISLENVMPGETEYIEKAYVKDKKLLYISNGSPGTIFAQIRYDVDIFLAKGVVPPQQFANDYEYVDSLDQYKFKQERIDKVAQILIDDYENMPRNDIYKVIGDRHYVYLTEEDPDIGDASPNGSTTEGVYPLQLKLTGEFGGRSKDPTTGNITPLRQFEQKSNIKITPVSKVVQNSKNLAIEAFGDEDISKLPPTWFIN